MTNAITNMIAWGSSRPLLGNNPLAVGVPQEGGNPIVLDMAMSQAAIGKIVTYLREEKETPIGWGLDSEGKPTTNPRTMLTSKRILPFGDHKGAGLALIIELLTSGLAGGMLSHEIAAVDPSGLDPNSTKLFIALHTDLFGDKKLLTSKIELFRNWMHTTEPGIHIQFPGDHSWQAREENLKFGIPLHPDILARLKKINIELE
jgi:LDH2 family malate/lactate/ureidoglycolate dehydrogenase